MCLALVVLSPEEEAQRLPALLKKPLVEITAFLGNRLRLQQRQIDEQQIQISEFRSQEALMIYARQQAEARVKDEANLLLIKTPDGNYASIPGNRYLMPAT